MRWIKKLAGLVLVGTIVALIGSLALRSLQSTAQSLSPSTQRPQPSPVVVYATHELPTSLVHTVTVPPSGFAVKLALAPSTATLEQFVQQHRPLAALNGGFFDPQNQQSTSYVIQQGQLVGDPTQNARLMDNPELTPYLEKILDRSEFRRYRCGDRAEDQLGDPIKYGIARHREAAPAGCELRDALGAGPQLLFKFSPEQSPEQSPKQALEQDLRQALEQEGFTATDVTGAIVRDALGSRQPNARTGLGILADGSILWVMAAQKPGMAASGLSLFDLAAFMQAQGAEVAMNLDGGSSAALFYDGQIHYGRFDANAEPVIRPIKSVLLVEPTSG